MPVKSTKNDRIHGFPFPALTCKIDAAETKPLAKAMDAFADPFPGKENPMKANDVTRGAGNRICGAKLRESAVASPLTGLACEELQQLFNEVAPPGRTAPVVQDFVDFTNLVAQRRFEEFLALDREVRHLRNVCASLAEQRDAAATEVASVLAPTKEISDKVLPQKAALKLWLHGPVERTARSLHLQAGDLAWWGREAGDDLGKPVLPGVRMDVDAIVGEVERTNGKLSGIMGSLDEAAGRLESTLARARKAGEACDQCYLQAKATVEVVWRLGGQAERVKKYGPPSLRKLNRTKKRKRKGDVAEQVLEDAVTLGDSLAASPALSAQESDLQIEESPIAVRESDLQTGTRSPVVQESDLEVGTRSPSVEESDLQTGTCSPGVCRDSSALPDRSRRKRRREFAVTSGGGGHGGRLSAVTDSVRGACRGRLSVTKGVCGPRRSGSEVTDTVRSPENRGGALQEGVTARIRRFLSRPFG
jgi:hypothetical protein